MKRGRRGVVAGERFRGSGGNRAGALGRLCLGESFRLRHDHHFVEMGEI